MYTGEVPGLFTNEELNKELAPLEQQKNEDPTYTGPNNTYVYFTHRCCMPHHIGCLYDTLKSLKVMGLDAWLLSLGVMQSTQLKSSTAVVVYSSKSDAMHHNSNLPLLLSRAKCRVSQNLHIAISMDPSNDLFRPRCESNPALLSRCAVQWLDRWSDSTKTHIARMRLKVRCVPCRAFRLLLMPVLHGLTHMGTER
eukprot:1136764-Pelagomonas_calceolata.AAC.12